MEPRRGFLLIFVSTILWLQGVLLCYAEEVCFRGTIRLKEQKIADDIWMCAIVIRNESEHPVLMQPDVTEIMVRAEHNGLHAVHYFCFGWNDAKPFEDFPPKTTKQTGVLLDESCLKKIQQQNSDTYVLIPYKLHGQAQIFNASIKVSVTGTGESAESETQGNGDK